jgi:DNA/RNA-binding domain of Phe-tRNA-synthetase-like protein
MILVLLQRGEFFSMEQSPTPVVDKLQEQLRQLGIKPKATKAEMQKQLKRAQKLQQEQSKLNSIYERQRARDLKYP